jgi:hypothetical protein
MCSQCSVKKDVYSQKIIFSVCLPPLPLQLSPRPSNSYSDFSLRTLATLDTLPYWRPVYGLQKHDFTYTVPTLKSGVRKKLDRTVHFTLTRTLEHYILRTVEHYQPRTLEQFKLTTLDKRGQPVHTTVAGEYLLIVLPDGCESLQSSPGSGPAGSF